MPVPCHEEEVSHSHGSLPPTVVKVHMSNVSQEFFAENSIGRFSLSYRRLEWECLLQQEGEKLHRGCHKMWCEQPREATKGAIFLNYYGSHNRRP